MLSKKEILDRFKQVNVWQRGDKRAPHKPLLLMYALGRCSRKEGNEIPYLDVERDLRQLLIDFGPPSTPRPEMPFWYLQNDGLWFVSDAQDLERRKWRTDPKRSEFLSKNPVGGLLPEVYDMLSTDDQLLRDIVCLLLSQHFPDSYHKDICDAVGLAWGEKNVVRSTRDPGFRQKMLRAYGHRCAVCGYDLKLGASDLGLEAAHIKWYQADGPDTENNGLALCALHHSLFDRGAFSLADDLSILVSQEVHGSTGLEEVLLSFHGRSVVEPQSVKYRPSPEFLQWHRREVFRSPARDRT
jgi:putative restriction endonuclease